MPSQSAVAPLIDQSEVQALASKYGQPLCRRHCIETDAYLRSYRGNADPNRRGEVVFAIRQINGEILLHTKHRYEKPIYRLPTGRIERGESVERALFREIAEETGQRVQVCRFLGVLDCHFINGSSINSFVSYVFYLQSLSEGFSPTDTDEIAGFRTVPAQELGLVAEELRSLDSFRRCWGYWRSLSHDLVHSALACGRLA
ncbi:MAG: NUDIX hydrolase [Caldilineaceae bacterium SB0670_bin_27]|uniref:NUDIX hydrolase n=1 Tax=Caldilineaceae bacterium SB0664_bin_27 TaxID=2605260 RepID=A0A6B0YQD5_9CHLR|nr:NUDIX hydrolase [Caldilineaceae bacterium SB0664_bin_27]MYJ78038.1 NUDIX hydrolase [Caldilineaceae bacterium SB0670_bin_27]